MVPAGAVREGDGSPIVGLGILSFKDATAQPAAPAEPQVEAAAKGGDSTKLCSYASLI